MHFFPSHCRQLHAHKGLCDCWGFFCIIVGSLPYNVNQIEATMGEVSSFPHKVKQIYG